MYPQVLRVLRAECVIESKYVRRPVIASKNTFQQSLTSPIQSSGLHTGLSRSARRAKISSTTADGLGIEDRGIPVSPFHSTITTRASNELVYAPDRSLVGLTGGQIVCEMLRRQKVDSIFGYPGGTILPVFDALHDCPDFRFILPRHEQGAGHMAQGYARSSRKPGVVLTTSGPGTTNLITPLQDALKDGTPLIVLVGQVSTHAIGTDAFQEADVIGITGPCTKWNTVVRDVRDLPARMNDAFRIAGSGRQGPVLVALPKDVTSAVLDTPALLTSSHCGLPQWDNPIQPSDILAIDRSARIKRCADLINRAQKPVIYAGNGVLSCDAGPQLLAQLAETACIPVATSLLGLGCFDEHDSKSLRMLGMHGTAYANKAIQEADLVIALGARFDDRAVGDSSLFAPVARAASKDQRGGIIHFEIHPPHINKVIPCDEFVQGDVTAGLIELLPHIREVENRPEWMSQISHWKNTFPIKATPPKHATRVSPEFVIHRLSELTEKLRKRTIVTTGVGSHQMWAAQFFRWTGDRSLITSGGAGTMGFGLPAAIGAHVAQPDAIVIDIDGDASLSMSLHEMSTAAEFGAKVKILVLNNDEQGMVTSWQALYHDQRYTHAHQRNPDFVKVANGMGVEAQQLDAASDITDKLEWFIRSEGPSLLDVKVDDKVPVLPWVTPGKALDEMFMSPSQIWTSKR